jgi:glucoside 3-dehydrogenase (cytochrome c) hitch-hiker subunit
VDRRKFLERFGGISAALSAGALLHGLDALARQTHERANLFPRLRTMNAAQDATLACIAEILLPQTDTIGASAVGVNRFVDLLLTESMLDEQRERFLRGLAQIDARCHSRYGTAFAASSASHQEALIGELDRSLPTPTSSPRELAARAHSTVTPESGYAQVKELVILGYFTSEPVVKGLIDAPIIPGRYDGCTSS